MARVTVEDCIDKVPGRFDLVLLAAHRSRAMTAGSEILVERDNDKNPVVALREIADEKVAPEELEEDLITSLQRYSEIEEVGDEEELALLESPEEVGDKMEEMSEEDLLAALQQEADESGK